MTRTRFYCGRLDMDGCQVAPARYLQVMDQHYTGYNILHGQGVWKSDHEPCIIFEVLEDVETHPVKDVARRLRDIGNQTTVLYTTEQVEGHFV